jgi:hypothetical protein
MITSVGDEYALRENVAASRFVFDQLSEESFKGRRRQPHASMRTDP